MPKLFKSTYTLIYLSNTDNIAYYVILITYYKYGKYSIKTILYIFTDYSFYILPIFHINTVKTFNPNIEFKNKKGGGKKEKYKTVFRVPS